MADGPGNSEIITLYAGEGRCRVEARIISTGDHLVIVVSGGEAHIGAVALAEPYPSRTNREETSASVSVLTRTTHKENEIAGRIASQVASARQVPVLVCCGIHLDKITKQEIDHILENADELSVRITSPKTDSD